MTALLGLVLAAIYAFLAAVHVYWALGGRRWKAAAIPETTPGRPAFKPGPISTLVIAIALFGSAVLLAALGGALRGGPPRIFLIWPASVLALVMLVRGIGDFRFVGLFKRPNPSPFARLDTLLYSPLCIALGAGIAALIWSVSAQP